MRGVTLPSEKLLVAVAAISLGACGGSDQAEGDDGAGRGDTPVGEACDATEECVPGSVCFSGYCVGTGALRVSLAFSVDSDFDLRLVTPLGGEISFENESADGGFLDVDQCVDPCGTGEHVENIVFVEAAPRGTYGVSVANFDGRAAGAFTIEVAGAADETFEGTLPGEPMAVSETFSFSVP